MGNIYYDLNFLNWKYISMGSDNGMAHKQVRNHNMQLHRETYQSVHRDWQNTNRTSKPVYPVNEA